MAGDYLLARAGILYVRLHCLFEDKIQLYFCIFFAGASICNMAVFVALTQSC